MDPQEAPVPAEGGERPPAQARCPLCGGAMRARHAGALSRMFGMAVVYVSAFAVLNALPAVRPMLYAGCALAALGGVLLARRDERLRCESCLHVRK